MYSLRARIGVIAPLDDQVEYAFNKYAPEGVSFDSTRLSFPGPTPEGLIYLSDQLEEAARMYQKKRHDVVLFGCTSAAASKVMDLIRSVSNGLRGPADGRGLPPAQRCWRLLRPSGLTGPWS